MEFLPPGVLVVSILNVEGPLGSNFPRKKFVGSTSLNRPWGSLRPKPHVPSPCFWVPLVGPLKDWNLAVQSRAPV